MGNTLWETRYGKHVVGNTNILKLNTIIKDVKVQTQIDQILRPSTQTPNTLTRLITGL
jgi:hypothetical protein